MTSRLHHLAAVTIALAFAVLMLITERMIAGVVQCHAAQTCPNQTPPSPTLETSPVAGGNLAGGAPNATGLSSRGVK